MYGSWDIRHDKQFFLSLWVIFCPLLQPGKSKFWKNEKKPPENIINLLLHTTNDDHMMYGSLDMKRYRQNFLSFWTIFCPLPRKSKFWKNEKNAWKSHYFTQVYQKWQSYDVWFLRYDIPFIPLTARKIKIKKRNEKNTWRYQHFAIVYQKSWSFPIFLLRQKWPGDIIILQKCTKTNDHIQTVPEI